MRCFHQISTRFTGDILPPPPRAAARGGLAGFTIPGRIFPGSSKCGNKDTPINKSISPRILKQVIPRCLPCVSAGVRGRLSTCPICAAPARRGALNDGEPHYCVDTDGVRSRRLSRLRRGRHRYSGAAIVSS
ncbi:hypothetical protein EVAR_102070_1 [Eumeta japonica]|uniref:Uncharacterized protein n=1 Tax=Eumeta variegata TaxID=151549 RepID=A0A4C1TZN2_EUMVA|nr:hypothetical protein EVAR_102070_1 [Eumeta japonica]